MLFSFFFLALHVANIVYFLQKPEETAPSKDKDKNPMKEVRIRKLCLNICVGESGDKLTRAAKVSSS